MRLLGKVMIFIMGFLICVAVSAPRTGDPNRIDGIVGFPTSFIFKVPQLSIKVHIHHWLYLLVISYFVKNPHIKWLCYGGAAQGLFMYKDSHCVVYTSA